MPPKGKAKAKGGGKQPSKHVLATRLPAATVLTDFTKKEWKLGQSIGCGGFGLIYLAERNHSGPVGQKAEYVVKVEPQHNGPLFCELHFYQRVAKSELINAWMKEHKMSSLGMPKFIASGIYTDKNQEKYRFMVMERFGVDLQKLFEGNGKRFPKKTVLILGIRLFEKRMWCFQLEVLEYIHSHDYVHADIKASNLLLGYKQSGANQVYLVDYGLAFRYIHDGKHKEYKIDPKWRHNGTIEFTSRDAHDGLTPSRRGDLEILAYCMLQWLCGALPWEDNLNDCVYVQKQKNKFMDNIPLLMKTCFPSGEKPDELAKFLQYINGLDYDTRPDYARCKQLLTAGLKKLGQKDDGKLDFTMRATPAAKAPKGRKRKSYAALSDSDDEEDDEVIQSPPKQRKTTKTPVNDIPVTNGSTAKGKKGKGTAQSPRGGAAAARKGKSPAAATTARKVKSQPAAGRQVKSPTTLAARRAGVVVTSPPSAKKAKSVVIETANAAAIRKKKMKANVACQTSPGLKGLKRSRRS